MYIARKPVRFDKDYAIGDVIPDEVIDMRMEKRLLDWGKIAKVSLPGVIAPGTDDQDKDDQDDTQEDSNGDEHIDTQSDENPTTEEPVEEQRELDAQEPETSTVKPSKRR